MKNVAVILAGGKGNRFGAEVPKQFLEVCGKTVIEHTIHAFESHSEIDEIAVVCREENIADLQEIVEQAGFKKVKHILKGGKERYHSSLSAINAYDGATCNLLIHDGVRPLVSHSIISSCISALRSYEAVDVAIPVTDTIIELREDGSISRIPPRSLLRAAQTPQCFRLNTIAEAFRKAIADPDFFPTDDCSIVQKYLPEVAIKVVEGEQNNIKITFPEDILFMENVLSK